jgi:predicted RNA binding protein YcfA (HicA-like mRNA interferase family)
MKLPRDLSGIELARRLARYGYEIRRQTGSHMRLTSLAEGPAHHITIPAHRCLAVGTLSRIVSDVAAYLGRDREGLALEMFSG